LGRSLAGFSNPGVLTIGALFMVAAGMYSTGAISLLSEKIIGRPKSVLGAQAKILPPIAIGSAFLNNTPLVAMMIPVIRDLCRATGLSKAKLYIPLSALIHLDPRRHVHADRHGHQPDHCRADSRRD
jgi:Na+/H+ antiporter NhaD/arsenite permease-like protein